MTSRHTSRHRNRWKPFSDAAFGMTPGQMSQPIETEFGVHLIEVTEVKPSEGKFEDAKDAVRRALIRQLLEKTAAEQRKVTKAEKPHERNHLSREESIESAHRQGYIVGIGGGSELSQGPACLTAF